jgi:hypothetical protein
LFSSGSTTPVSFNLKGTDARDLISVKVVMSMSIKNSVDLGSGLL